jgi:hypothetical protein
MRIRLLIVMLATLLSAFHVNAQPRPEAPGPVVELPAETVDQMNEAWERNRNPKMLVMFGVADGGRMRYDLRSSALDRISAPLLNELNRAFPGGLVALEVAAARERDLLDRINRNLGADLDADAETSLAEAFGADIIIDVALMPGGRAGEYAPSLKAVDTRNASIIATTSLRSVDPLSHPQIGFVYGTELAKRFGEGFVLAVGKENGGRPQTYSIKLIAMAGDSGLDSRDARRLARSIEEDVRDVNWAEAEEVVEGDQRYIKLEVRYAGRSRDLLDDIELDVLEPLGLGWNLLSVDGIDIAAVAFKAVRPQWHVLTDANDQDGQAARQLLYSQLVEGGLPRLAVLVGDEVSEFGMASTTETESVARLDPEIIRTALENQFADLGFRIVDAAALQRQVDTARGNAERYDNLPHLLEALGELQGVDLVVHVNQAGTRGSGVLVVRFFDPKSAEVIGTQSWPDQSASKLAAYSVSPNRADEVARFISGRLLERWNRVASQNLDTIDLQIRNVADPQKVLAFVDVARDAVRGVRSIADVQIATPVASMELVYEGDESSLTLSLLEQLGAAFPGAEIQKLGAGIVVNLRPVVLSEQELRQRREREIRLDVTSPEEDAQGAPLEEPAQKTIAETLREARDSVWLIQVQTETVSWVGTGWTVGPGLLATNAHVVGDVPERRAAGQQVRVIAWSDADGARELVLGRAWRHPRWSEGGEEFWYDVGVFEVTSGNAGNPLEIAADAELDELIAPIIAGYVGFPSEHAIKGRLPSKQAFIGQINAVLDTSLTPTSSSRADRMVTHNMTSSQGSSGSPIFGEDGKVVALLNAGSFRSIVTANRDGTIGESTVPTGFNAGVMVDILTDFIKSIERELND